MPNGWESVPDWKPLLKPAHSAESTKVWLGNRAKDISTAGLITDCYIWNTSILSANVTWKSEDAYSKVPSPPKQMMKSTRLERSSKSVRHKTSRDRRDVTERATLRTDMFRKHCGSRSGKRSLTFSESAKVLFHGHKALVVADGRVLQDFPLHVNDHLFLLKSTFKPQLHFCREFQIQRM